VTVIAYRAGIMAADTGGWYGDICACLGQRKVRRTGAGGLAGCCGHDPQCEQFYTWVAAADWAPQRNKPFEAEQEGDFGAIVVQRDGKIVHLDHKLRHYSDSLGWAVEGCHQEFMIALMLAGKTAIEAVELAIKHCSHAAGEVFWLQLGFPESLRVASVDHDKQVPTDHALEAR
jgi:hypothetical protein